MRWTGSGALSAVVRLSPAVLGAAAGALALGPALGAGYVLRYDMVFVPDPPLSPMVLGAGDGFPRAVPSDAAVAVLARLLPDAAVQPLVLLAVFALGAAGAARLVPGPYLVPRLAAALCYVWNGYLAERLLLGQWALLLGYAGLPWVLAAAARLERVRDLPRMLVALLPAAVGGFSSVLLSALVVVPMAVLAGGGGRRPWWRRVPTALRRTALVGAALVAVSLPWLVPALSAVAADVRTDPAAVELFAARADTPFGALGSLLTLGGIWNAHAVPAGHGHLFPATCRLLLAVAAVAGWAWWVRTGRIPSPLGRGLSVAAGAGFAVAAVGTTETGRTVLAALITAWPGFGPLRDGQLYVAPLALVQAVGCAALAHALRRPEPGGGTVGPEREPRRRSPDLGRAAGPLAAVLLVVLPVVLVPGLAWGAAGRLVAVEYPAEWARVRAAVDGDPAPGALLTLPWSAYRGLDWSGGGRTVVALDPATKGFARRVVWNDALRVASDGRVYEIAGEDPTARAVAPLVAGGWPAHPAPDVPRRLGALGIRYVLVDRTALARAVDAAPGAAWPDPGPDVQVVHEGPRFALLRIADRHVTAVPDDLPGAVTAAWAVTGSALLWAGAAAAWAAVRGRRSTARGER
ncbi:hypothetical protein [Marinitenerispora sediminis]|uniref:hypothetical protein n=1 Tax=Marinitenerispora sediminis TaxID=1931232 RepID=UPI001314D285|nr:hypothetical protein [Marinitenerispora sediminis]